MCNGQERLAKPARARDIQYMEPGLDIHCKDGDELFLRLSQKATSTQKACFEGMKLNVSSLSVPC